MKMDILAHETKHLQFISTKEVALEGLQFIHTHNVGSFASPYILRVRPGNNQENSPHASHEQFIFSLWNAMIACTGGQPFFITQNGSYTEEGKHVSSVAWKLQGLNDP